MHPSRTPRRLSTLADIRSQATEEPRQLALAELTPSATAVVPSPSSASQEMWEALVLTALMDHYGAHRPAETGGPYGICHHPTPCRRRRARGTGRAWTMAQALVPVRRADGSWTGLADLRWTAQSKGVLIQPADGTARLVLARTFA
ncbi:hypothetical protein ACLQ2D_33945 [Streptomyces sp. DT199]|uniref:hypothetical protein n=1 Tax=Streptomyces sp. DT199 TaxID=3393421 RepID=UPI003CEF7A0D